MGTITKALNLLNYFSECRAEIGLSEFRRMSGQDKATLHRHLAELEQNGFLQQNTENRAYRLGPAILRLASIREISFPARRTVTPIVDALSGETGELGHVSTLQGLALSSLYTHSPECHSIRVHLDESILLPLHATASGMALLAFGPEHLLAEVSAGSLEQFTPHTPTDKNG